MLPVPEYVWLVARLGQAMANSEMQSFARDVSRVGVKKDPPVRPIRERRKLYYACAFCE